MLSEANEIIASYLAFSYYNVIATGVSFIQSTICKVVRFKRKGICPIY